MGDMYVVLLAAKVIAQDFGTYRTDHSINFTNLFYTFTKTNKTHHSKPRNHQIRVREIFQKGKDIKKIYQTLLSLSFQHCQEQNEQNIKNMAKNFSIQFKKRWAKACRIKHKFYKSNSLLLENYVVLACALPKGGRPKKHFENLTYSAKYKRTIKQLRTFNTNELLFASKMGLRSAGKSQAAKKLQNIDKETPNATKLNRLSSDTALAMVIDAKLSKRQYQNISESAIENNTDIYPPYNGIKDAKNRCYPKNILSSEHSVTVHLQSLLDHTTCRLLSTLELEMFKIKNPRLVLISKWGMDGSSGQSQYKQSFADDSYCDSNLLLTCIAPIQLYMENDKKEKVIIWNNPSPSSTRLCRPLKMQFLKETVDISKRETQLVKNQIQALSETKFKTNSLQILFVKHDLYMTMLDMKMINSLTDTSLQKCYLCGAFSLEMNDIEKLLQKSIMENHLQYGITSLHSWIRSFEFLLKVCYRLPIKKWQARGDDEKSVIRNQKQHVQSEFKKQLGIIVDQPKQRDGSSNDGNCARAFFRNYSSSSKITGLDESLIYRFYVILQVIASGFNINLEKFRTYCLDTAKLYISLYPWYRMPVSIHKVLLHGPAIINALPVPIGQLSEEAQEARNKEYRRYREHNSRESNRTLTNIDVFNSLCISSDPVITSLRKKTVVKKKTFSPEALSLLESHLPNPVLDSSSESDSA